jgi:flagellar basal body P-ring formation protein FlgA
LRGEGFAINAEGQALMPGLEGQAVRVRTDNGRVLNGRAVAERRVEVIL